MPSYWDLKGRLEWFDCLLNYSGMGNRAQLLTKDPGLNLDNSSRTVIGFADQPWSMGSDLVKMVIVLRVEKNRGDLLKLLANVMLGVSTQQQGRPCFHFRWPI